MTTHTNEESAIDDNPDQLGRILEETKDYYDKRASEYSDWSSKDEYEGESESDALLPADVQVVFDALDSNGLAGDILEIASGTGIWTERLIKGAASITALDSSPDMLERCKVRVKRNAKVRYVLADFYEWIPDRAYDAVTFAFWISHVPNSRLDEFVSKVSLCLKNEGRVFFVDQRSEAMGFETLDRPGGEIATRRLNDGREFKIIKHFYSTEEIEKCFLKNGIGVKVFKTP